MASYYVRSLAAGAGTGANWANAFTTLAAAYSGKAAGDIFYVSEDHAETQASALTLSSPGSAALPCYVYCVDHAGSVPPVSADLRTTATITTTGANALNINNNTYYYGITFNAGSGAVNSILQVMQGGNGLIRFDSCSLRKLGTTANGAAITLGGTGLVKVIMRNTTVQFGNVADGLKPLGAWVVWKDTPSAIVGTPPTSLLAVNNGSTAFRMELTGVDLSAISSGPIFPVQGNTGLAILQDCKIASGVTVATTPNGRHSAPTDLIRCDNGAVNYRSERYWYEGTQSAETTIVRTGGATDGTTPVSWKLVTTANSNWVDPFDSLPITIWNDTVGSPITVTMYGIWGGGAVPNSDDIWIEAEYPGASGNPQGSFITSSKADNLATGSALTSDSSTWGGSTTKFKMSVTFTPQMKGPINLTVKAAKASTTFYFDPKPEISGVTVSKSMILAPGVYASELSSGSSGAHIATRQQLGM